MQYREQGNKIQVLAYRGYNKEMKRAEVKMLGSFDRYSFKMTDDLLKSMTVEEQKEFTVELEKRKQSHDKSMRLYHVNQLVSRIVEVDDCLKTDGLTFDVSKITTKEVTAVYSVMKALTKALEDAGHPAPKRPYKAKAVAVVVAGDDAKQLPLA